MGAKMDFQNRVGHKMGTGGPATDQEVAMDRRERLRKLALETIDLSKDPYFLRNHLGSYECKLCLTIQPQPSTTHGPRKTVKIGRPGYRVTKKMDPQTEQKALLFEIEYPEALE